MRSEYKPIINGRYQYHSWNSMYNGPIYYNSIQNVYLYPWKDFSDVYPRRYLFHKNVTNTIGYAYCRILVKSDPDMSPEDCYYGQTYPLHAWVGNESINDYGSLSQCSGTSIFIYFTV